MRRNFVLFIFLISTSGFASSALASKRPTKDTEKSVRLYLLNSEMRYDRDNSQEISDRKPFSLSAGLQWNRWSLIAEYSKYTEQSGNASAAFDRTHQGLMAWGRYNAIVLKSPSIALMTQIYVGAGVGTYQEEVTTTLLGNNRDDKSNLKMMSGLCAGTEVSYGINKNFGVLIALEGRTHLASDFDPNPIFGAIVRTGVVLPLF